MTIYTVEMANYRRTLSHAEHKDLLDRYKNHRDADGGIFTPDKRRKLLGIKAKSNKQFTPDTADFWYDVRTTVRGGLKDLELFFEVAHPDQIKTILHDMPIKEQTISHPNIQDYETIARLYRRIPSLQHTLTALLRDYKKKRIVKRKNQEPLSYEEPLEKDDLWRAMLVHDLVQTCIRFLKEHNLVSSMAHERLAEEFENMVNVEVSRTVYLDRFERVKGFL